MTKYQLKYDIKTDLFNNSIHIDELCVIMAKENEKKLAKVFYVEQKKTAKEIAEMVNVSEKTVGAWVEKYGWKKERGARMFSATERITNIEDIISDCAERRISLNKQLLKAEKDKETDLVEDLRKQMSQLADEAVKWNKTLDNLKVDSKVSLSTYIHVMESIFKDLHNKHPEIYLKTIDFQEQHINTISNTL